MSSLRTLISCAALAGWLVLAAPGAVAQGAAALPARFLIAEFRIEGNTVLKPALIEQLVQSRLGPDRALADVQAARDALAQAYEQAGLQAATVEALRLDPADTPDGPGWVAVLQVAEGPVSRVKVTGAQYNAPSVIAQALPSVQEGRPLDFPRFQQDLARVATLAGVTATPVLRPGRDPGTMEVEIKVQDTLPLAAWAELTNDASPDTSARRLELGARYDNLWQAQHQLSARLITTPLKTDEIRVVTASYSWPDGERNRWSVYGVISDSLIQANTGTGVIGTGRTAGLRWTHSRAGEPGIQQSLTMGADFKNLAEDSAAAGSRPLRYAPLSAQYTLVSSEDDGRWIAGAQVNAGTRLLSSRRVNCQGFGDADQFACKRAGATPGFIRLGLNAQREQRLGGWQLLARAELQLASEPLIGNEQIYVGGHDSVRGFLASELGGDDGVRASLQLTSPRLGPEALPLDVTAIVFLDAGWVRRQQPLAGEAARDGITGAGLGLRVSWSRTLSASLDWARAVKAGPRTPEGTHRLHGSVRVEF